MLRPYKGNGVYMLRPYKGSGVHMTPAYKGNDVHVLPPCKATVCTCCAPIRRVSSSGTPTTRRT